MKQAAIYVIIGIVCMLSFTVLFDKYNKAIAENERLQNNIEYYSTFGKENIVLQSTVKELKESKDSLIQEIDSIQGLLKLKPKETKTVVYTETVINDTIRDTISTSRDFHALIQPNNLTSFEVIRKDTTLTLIPDIRNSQTVFIQTESRYKYKGFFNRLIRFNFSKIKQDKYYIHNTNNLIKVEETRVVNIVD